MGVLRFMVFPLLYPILRTWMNMYGGNVDMLVFSKEGIEGTVGSLSKQFEHFRPSACGVAEKCRVTMSCNDKGEHNEGKAILRILSDSCIGAGS